MSLMSELETLGETMATNITAKGVSASASDGLTTLAGKILQISGDTPTPPTPTPTILFEDGGVTGNVNTDYTDVGGTINATVSSTGTNISCSTYNNCARIPNVQLSGDFEITYTLVDRNGEGGGWFILNNNTSTSNFLAYIESNASQGWNIWYNSDSWVNQGKTVPCDVKITREDAVFTVYIDNTLVNSRSITDSDIYMGWKTHSAGGRNYTFKDLTITSGSTPTNPCEQYQTEISNAIEYINGSGS